MKVTHILIIGGMILILCNRVDAGILCIYAGVIGAVCGAFYNAAREDEKKYKR